MEVRMKIGWKKNVAGIINRNREIILCALLGAAVFVYIYGVHVLDPGLASHQRGRGFDAALSWMEVLPPCAVAFSLWDDRYDGLSE